MKRETPVVIAVAALATLIVMRAPVTCVGPVSPKLREALSMSYLLYGVLSSLPVFCLGLFCLAAPALARSLRTGGALSAICAMLAAGLALRLAPSVPSVFAGTLAIGAAIAMLNTLMPVLVRHYFPGHIAFAMGAYTAGIGISSSLGAAAAVPLETLGGSYLWAIGVWLLPALAAAAAWLSPRGAELPRFDSGARLRARIFARPAAWCVILTMSMQSLSLYTVSAWLSPILQTEGFSAEAAGGCTALFLLVSAPSSFFTSTLIRATGGERALSLWMTGIFLAGMGGWFLGGAWVYAGCVLAGISQGIRLSMAMILISAKSGTLSQMLSLSSAAQFAGYLIAALGPVACGSLYRGDGNWNGIYLFLALSTLVWGAAATRGFGPTRVFTEAETQPENS